MGFKRTSEGRVFFKGSNQSSPSAFAPGSDDSAPVAAGGGNAQTQMQILLLLRGLNEKLKATKGERARFHEELAAYRSLIEDLEGKADRSERAYLDLEQKILGRENLLEQTLKTLEETRKQIAALENQTKTANSEVDNLKSQIVQNQKINQAVAKKQIEIEKQQAEQGEKFSAGIARLQAAENWQQTFTERLEMALSEQGKLARKLDKTIEDRARFMRKIERIEETVIQTRDSLNAKAMVLLTDQNKMSDAAAGSEALSTAIRDDGAFPAIPGYRPFWRSHVLRVQSVAVSFLIVGGILTGWLISEFQKPFNAQYAQPVLPDMARPSAPASEASALNAAGSEWQTSTDMAPYTSAPEASAPDSLRFIDEGRAPTAQEDQANLELMSQNPEELATALNALEPSTPAPAEAPKSSPQGDENLPDISNQEPFEQASLTQGTAEELAPVSENPLPEEPVAAPAESSPAAQEEPAKSDIRAMIEPDASLPAAVKQIEAEAFDGSAEAQHDLAAIYTAGHGGVAQNYERAAFWFTRAAEGGIANARYNLAVLYHQGLGVRSDLPKAIYWYQEAARLGHPEAQYNLGIAHIEGIGVSYDPEMAARYFENAARQGIVEAAYNLGLIYENGLLGQAKPDEAMMWYKHAADQGNPEAQAALEQLARAIGVAPEDIGRITGNINTVAMDNSPSGVSADDGGNQALVAQIQEYLMRAGLYPGPADGINGPLTRDAVRSYQALNDLNVNGEINQSLLSHMLANTRDYRNIMADDNGVGSRAQ